MPLLAENTSEGIVPRPKCEYGDSSDWADTSMVFNTMNKARKNLQPADAVKPEL